MSFEAMAWASKTSTKNTVTKLVLMMLANYADESHSAFPSYAHLASLCECTERTVKRAIKELQDQGFLEVQQRFKDGRQTANRYVLAVGVAGVTEKAPRGVTQKTPPGVTETTPPGVTQTPPYTVSRIQSVGNNNHRAPKGEYPEAFQRWWRTYPRRDGSKAKAFESWRKAVKDQVADDRLLDITERFARQCANKDKKFVPHAATWLNQARWETVEETEQQTTNRNTLAG